MMMGIDLHIHSTYSDGTCTIAEILDKAKAKNIPAIAITDHDTISGVREIMPLCESYNVEVVPGIELSTRLNGEDVHILGYYPDINDENFCNTVYGIQDDRVRRNKAMVELMQQHGIDIDYESFIEEYPAHIITRASFGAFLVKHGYVKNTHDAFAKYIGVGCPCYLPRNTMSPSEGVEFLTKSKALSYIAHPGLYNFTDEQFEELLKELIPLGLTGIECYHSSHTLEQTEKYRKLAIKYKLLTSGGSDFHGANKPGISLATGRGDLFVPYHLLEQMRYKRQHKA